MSGSARSVVPAAAPDKSPDRIAGMFDAIAPRYDLLNRLLSAGIDRWWRKRAIDSLALTGREVMVDVATGKFVASPCTS
jgi:demethylmenaquinone methyltransferase/2-methoxy-6-polyprenyl-1,4-benzoquinol methylase